MSTQDVFGNVVARHDEVVESVDQMLAAFGGNIGSPKIGEQREVFHLAMSEILESTRSLARQANHNKALRSSTAPCDRDV